MGACLWKDIDTQTNRLRAQIKCGEKASTSFAALALLDSPELHKSAAKIWMGSRHPQDHLLGDIPGRKKGPKIRVGYYSADFRDHPVSHIAVEFLEFHDKEKFELYAFSYGPDTNDPVRQRISAVFDEFIDVRYASDWDVAQRSREFEIDIAIDLSGLTFEGRPGIFAHRAAPVQMSYLGYLGTMGAGYYDYLIADKTIIPPSTQKYYTEKIVYLPTYHARALRRPIAETNVTREALGLPSEGFVYCSFNNTFKITPSMFSGWMRILEEVTGSSLLLYTNTARAMENLKAEATTRGIDPNRIVRAEYLPLPEHLARLSAANLFLDTFPYNAGTSASDALWAGLPVLTRAGKSFASRMASSVLKATGVPELITRSQDEYEARAIELATNPLKLTKIKDKIHKNRSSSPLFNPKLFARRIEAAFSTMHERSHAGLPPEDFEVQS